MCERFLRASAAVIGDPAVLMDKVRRPYGDSHGLNGERAPAGRRGRPPCTLLRNPSQKNRFKSLTKRGYISVLLNGEMGTPGYHLRFPRSTQSAGGPVVTQPARPCPLRSRLAVCLGARVW